MEPKTLTPRFDRLNSWANFIEDLPHDRFHMPRFADRDCTTISCGTAGCAAGWAVTKFNDKGLVLYWPNANPLFVTPFYNGELGEFAISEFFGIPVELASWIIYERNQYWGDRVLLSYMLQFRLETFADVTPQIAADRIRRVIKLLGGEVQLDYKDQPIAVNQPV